MCHSQSLLPYHLDDKKAKIIQIHTPTSSLPELATKTKMWRNQDQQALWMIDVNPKFDLMPIPRMNYHWVGKAHQSVLLMKTLLTCKWYKMLIHPRCPRIPSREIILFALFNYHLSIDIRRSVLSRILSSSDQSNNTCEHIYLLGRSMKEASPW